MEFPNNLLTVREVASFLKLNPLTIYEYIRSGALRAARFGRYYRIEQTDLLAFISEHKKNIQPQL